MINFVDILFKLLNMTVLGCLCLYIVKRYLIPQIRAQIEADVKEIAHLKTHKKELSQEQTIIKGQFKQESNEWQLLKQKMALWNAQLDVAQASSDQEYIEQTERLYHYAVQKRDQQLAKQVRSYVIDHATQESRRELINLFADQTFAHAYINNITNTLQKRAAS